MKKPKTIIIKDSETIESHDIDGIKRKILFTPTIDGNRHLRFALTEVAPGSVAPLHSHPGDEVALTLSGSATLFVDGQEYEVREGTAVLLPPGVEHSASNTGSENWIVVSAYCDECPLLKKPS